jgi:hypothetical protein
MLLILISGLGLDVRVAPVSATISSNDSGDAAGVKRRELMAARRVRLGRARGQAFGLA